MIKFSYPVEDAKTREYKAPKVNYMADQNPTQKQNGAPRDAETPVCPKCGATIAHSDDLRTGMFPSAIEGVGIHLVFHRACGCPLPHLLVPVQQEKSMLI